LNKAIQNYKKKEIIYNPRDIIASGGEGHSSSIIYVARGIVVEKAG